MPPIANPDGKHPPGRPKEVSPFCSYLKIFQFAGSADHYMQFAAIVIAVISGIGIGLQNLIFGKFITVMTDFLSQTSTVGAFRSDVSALSLLFVLLGIARLSLSFFYNTLFTYSGYRVVRNIRLAYLHAALRQEVAYYDFSTSGSITAQAVINGHLIQACISERLGLAFQNCSAFVTSLIIAFAFQWKLTLICICIAPTTMVTLGIGSELHSRYGSKLLDIVKQANSFAESVLANVRTVHAFEMRARLTAKFDKHLAIAHKVSDKISLIVGFLFSVEYTIMYLGLGLAFWQSFVFYLRGDISKLGDIFTVVMCIIFATLNVTALGPFMDDYSHCASAAAELFSLIDRQSEIDPFDQSGNWPFELDGLLEMENVTFSYPTRQSVTVLDNFSLRIPAGKVTALVGQSGSGKSTIVGLIERWYNPNSGTIKLDGCPIDRLSVHWLRTNVRMVQQEPVLFDGTIFENIKHGLAGTQWEHATRLTQLQKVQEAAKISFAHDFITRLPFGYDTKIGQRGGLLSGGQKQRVAIARSIVSQPKVLLLDEATSALDPEAEIMVQRALENVSRGRTTVVIAHKLATVRKAHNIVVMKKGRIIEQGTHRSLLAKHGAYARLVRLQSLFVSDGFAPENFSDSPVEVVQDSPIETHAMPSDAVPLLQYMSNQHDMQTRKHEEYESHKQIGFVAVVWRLVKETPELTRFYVIVVIGCALAAVMFPGQAILIAHIVDAFLSPDFHSKKGIASFLASMFVVMSLGCLTVYFTLGYIANHIATHLAHKLRRESLHNVLRQDLRFFDRPENSIGALVSRLDSHAEAVHQLMGFNIGLIIIAMFSLAACSLLAIAHSWKLGLVIVFAGLPMLYGTGFMKVRSEATLDRDISKLSSASASVASEAVNAIRTVSSTAMEDAILVKYTTALDRAIADSKWPLFAAMFWFATTQAAEPLFQALGFWYGCRLLSNGDINFYQFLVAFLGVFFTGQACAQLIQFSSSVTRGVNGANWIFWLRNLTPIIQETPENEGRGPGSGGSVRLQDVEFSYPLRPDVPVLQGVNLVVKPGQLVALVGASGCGKSTIVAMLERFYDPTSGRLNIASTPVPSLSPRLYRRHMGLVQQEPTLFPVSIRENIALGVDDPASESTSQVTVSDERIETALRAANAWEFVSSLPEGLDTPVGSNGAQLSGGQKQRIAIARALIRNPNVLLLDEATSALDTESERVVQQRMAKTEGHENRLTIAVAHRLSTIKDADLICVFKAGKIVEAGTHQKLVAQGGLYRKMCEAQILE